MVRGVHIQISYKNSWTTCPKEGKDEIVTRSTSTTSVKAQLNLEGLKQSADANVMHIMTGENIKKKNQDC